ncbi:MAG: uracil-DNA glycosylase [Candidatus Magnetobacterium sp. LHC-1]|uniref:Type-4 uracil-DNA glycosylase n=1 Tax=Candidatus Magnetobacterium casense TaxID=1455061 RepID=A0ABS6RYP0_9BACT|nr:uracil-DNA glycosylase [Candidatus Magnetobacterium casensis]MBF0608680.1 uracil-DNA glycosylase [Nitrospirota bacterium]MBV6341743.1 uracil-DNA glycosylase [Candidatus Magnetobacterium casensis]
MSSRQDTYVAMIELLKVYKHLDFDVLPPLRLDVAPLEDVAPLQAVRDELGQCTRCKLHTGRKNIVFGEGSPTARLLFVGEGPGADEDEQGRPFVGRAGKLLTSLIEKMGFTRQSVYIANIVKCRPPGNRDPEEDEVRACIGFVEKQITAIAPEVIMTLGSVSTRTLLKTDKRISDMRGRFHNYNGIKVMPTFHPSYLLRNSSQKWVTWNDALMVLAALGLQVEGREGL